MAGSIPRDQLSADVADLVHRVAHDVRRSAKDQLAPLGITWGQVRALRTIRHHGGPLRMGVLADALGMVPRSATSVVDDLEAQGYVERTRDPGDRRAVAVVATTAGLALLDQLAAGRRSAAGQVLAPLTVAELTELRALLAKALPD